MTLVRVVRAFRISIIAAMTALTLAGCMRRPGPVATVPPPRDLDAMAYGGPAAPAPARAPVVAAGSGGALAALRAGFSSRRVVAAAPAVYAAPLPMPRPGSFRGRYKPDGGGRVGVRVH